MCQQCGGHFDTTTVIGSQDAAGTEQEPEAGSRAVGEAAEAALRVTLGRIVRLMVEVIGGRCPAGQLAAVADAPVLHYLRATRPVAPAGMPMVRSVRVCVPAERVTELSAVVGCGDRVRAVTARFERRSSRWRCIAVSRLAVERGC